MSTDGISFEPDPARRGGWILRSEVLLPRRCGEVFSFFADATNLEQLTPPWLRFEVLTPQPITMRVGLQIEYRLRVHGLPIRWQSEITVWEPSRRFIDAQRRGPYRWWIHEHTFRPEGEGTVAGDRVSYGVPGGRLMNALFVRRDLRRIFAYRQAQLLKRFA